MLQIGRRIAMMKNGSQQMTKAPVIIANVLAAFRSRLELASSFDFLALGGGCGVAGW